MNSNDQQTNNLLELFKLDYEKSIDVSLRLEQTKLTYQRFYIALVSTIGTISVGFLKLKVFETNGSIATIEVLIGLLLVFSTVLGYTIIRNLVSIRRQCCYFNNTIIFLRSQLIETLGLSTQYPMLKRVPANHQHSADYITIVLCSAVNLFMLCCGFALLLNLTALTPLALAFCFVTICITYFLVHVFTIEKILNKEL